jgi:hypothetical protein
MQDWTKIKIVGKRTPQWLIWSLRQDKTFIPRGGLGEKPDSQK